MAPIVLEKNHSINDIDFRERKRTSLSDMVREMPRFSRKSPQKMTRLVFNNQRELFHRRMATQLLAHEPTLVAETGPIREKNEPILEAHELADHPHDWSARVNSAFLVEDIDSRLSRVDHN